MQKKIVIIPEIVCYQKHDGCPNNFEIDVRDGTGSPDHGSAGHGSAIWVGSWDKVLAKLGQ